MAHYGGLQITGGGIRALVLDGKSLAVLDTFNARYQDAETLKAALGECAARFALRNAEWAVGVPLGEFSVRHVSFPFANRRAIAQALPFELESTVPYPAAEMETAFMTVATGKEGTKVLACAMRKDRLAFYKDALKDAGMEVRAITPDAAALLHFYRKVLLKATRQEPAPSIIASVEGDELLLCFAGDNGHCDIHTAPAEESELRRFAAAMAPEPEKTYIGGEEKPGFAKTWAPEMWKRQLDALLGGGDAATLMVPAGLAAMAASYADDLSFPVGGGGRKLKFASTVRFTAIAAASLVVLGFGYLSFRNYTQQRAYERITGQMRAAFNAAVPDAKAVKPAFQMRQRLASLEERMRRAGLGGSGRMDLLWVMKRMAESLPEGMTMEVDEITYEEDGVTVSAKTDKFESVNRIKELYSIIAPFKSADVTDSRTSADGKRVSFKLRMQL